MNFAGCSRSSACPCSRRRSALAPGSRRGVSRKPGVKGNERRPVRFCLATLPRAWFANTIGQVMNPGVAAYLKSLEHPHKAAVVAIRKLILDIDSRVEEEVKWNAPS